MHAVRLRSADRQKREHDRPRKTSVVTTTKKQTNDDSKADEQALKNYEETKIVANAIPYVKFSKSVEAETGSVSGKAKVKSDRKGYKGKGYVTNISAEEDWSREIELTDSQYYDLTITVASDVPCVNGIAVNGKSFRISQPAVRASLKR